MKTRALLAVAMLTVLASGCAFNIKNTETFHNNNLTEKVALFFNPPVIMNWWGAKGSKNWKLSESKKEVLPVDKEVSNKVFTTVKGKLRDQGIMVAENNSDNLVKVTLYTSYDFGLHHDLLDGIRLLEGRIILEKNGSLLMRTYASWNGAIGADYDRGVESVSDALANEIILWINGKSNEARSLTERDNI